MDIDRTTPPDGSYRHVLVFPSRPSGVTWTESNFTEIKTSRTLPWPEEWPLPHVSRDGHGAAPTRAKPDTVWFFVGDEALRDRLVRKGALDVTEAWASLKKLAKQAGVAASGGRARVKTVQGAPPGGAAG